MVLGAIWCPQQSVRRINSKIKNIKTQYGLKPSTELKWTKISTFYKDLYEIVTDYFFDETDLHYRCIIADKTNLNHTQYNQTHDEWYYKMYYQLLKEIFHPRDNYEVYIDIKDRHSYNKTQKLHEICCNEKEDFSREIIKRIQPIRSDEVQIMQITDILTGAVSYRNRNAEIDSEATESSAKASIIKRIMKKSGYSLDAKTLLREDKFNIFVWDADWLR